MVAQGERVIELEQRFAAAVDAEGAVAVASGTAALTLALRALDLPPGSEIVIPTYVCINVLHAVRAAGGRAILCDVEEDWTMTPETVHRVLTPSTRAVIAVHTMGVPCDVRGVRELGLPVVEDACQAWGAVVKDGVAGALGDIAIVSTHATKCLTTGEGGVLLSRDPAILARVRESRDTGGPDSVRFAAPMSDLQASMGLSQLARYDAFLERRQRLAGRYFEQLSGLGISLPRAVRERSMFFRFPVRCDEDFSRVQAAFLEEGVQVRRGVDTLLHLLVSAERQHFPVAERLYRETVSLPLYPALTDEHQDLIIAASRRIWNVRGATQVDGSRS
jgi:UDP-4-amino-4-deoxy-L-arabinose-oxoglutarate aminotransferase